MRRFALLPLLFGLAGCNGGLPGGAPGPTIPEAIAAADLVQAAQVAKLASLLGPASDAVAAGSVTLTLDEAANGMVGDAAALRSGLSLPRAAAAHLELALPGLQALQAGYAGSGPSQAAQAGRLGVYRDAFLAAARSYNGDAVAAGLPVASLPAH